MSPNIRNILEKLHVILAYDGGHNKIFPNVPMIGTSGKAHLIRSQLRDLDEIGRSVGRKIPPFHLWENMKDTCTFKSKHINEVHEINRKYNCNSKMTVYLIECEMCGEQYTGSTKPNLGLGQRTMRIRRGSLLTKRKFESKP